MMTFVNMDSPGLAILPNPSHRAQSGIIFRGQLSRRSAKCQREEVDPSIDASRANVILRKAAQRTAMIAVTGDHAFLLDTPGAIGTDVFAGLSLRQQSLDVVQLHKCMLEGVLGISEEAIRDQQNIRYIRDAGEALA